MILNLEAERTLILLRIYSNSTFICLLPIIYVNGHINDVLRNKGNVFGILSIPFMYHDNFYKTSPLAVYARLDPSCTI